MLCGIVWVIWSFKSGRKSMGVRQKILSNGILFLYVKVCWSLNFYPLPWATSCHPKNFLRSLMSGPHVVVSFMPVWMLEQSCHFLRLVVFYTYFFLDHQNQVLFFTFYESGNLACSKPLIKQFINFCVGFWAASDHRYFTFLLVTKTLVYLQWCTKAAAPYVLVSLLII